MIRFRSFSSGSAGNCYLLAHDGGALLIDAGVSVRRLKAFLQEDGLAPGDLGAVLITHDHGDHIRHLGSFCKRLGQPVWATEVLHAAFFRHPFTRDCVGACRRVLPTDTWTQVVPGFSVRPFEVPHDATQTVGFAISVRGLRYVHITDAGAMTPEALAYARQADVLTLESNFDMDMLLAGKYPHELKMRICQGHGHLSNDACADTLRRVWHPGLKQIFLCHLSENNNTPQLALESASRALLDCGLQASGPGVFTKEGAQTLLRALPRRQPSPTFILSE